MALDDQDKQWIRAQLHEQLEAMETRLLTAFHGWASPIDMRLKSHAAVLRALDVEQEAHAERLDKLEGRKPA